MSDGLIKDPGSHAIINTQYSEYERQKAARARSKQLSDYMKKVVELEQRVAALEGRLKD